MVHALKQLWRVLVPHGSLIDLRPLAQNPPVEIVVGEQVFQAGRADVSSALPDDVVSDKSLDEVVDEGWFVRECEELFDYAIYWDTLDEMIAYAEWDWIRVFLPEAMLTEARRLLESSGEGARLRVRRRIVISRYRKQI
jgi:hypothetical protein